MKRTAYVAIFVSGLAIGAVIAVGWPAQVVEAQGAWQCRSFTLEEKADAAVVGTWLGTAANVHVTSAGLSAGSRQAVVACKR
jgi:hypothetical protein